MRSPEDRFLHLTLDRWSWLSLPRGTTSVTTHREQCHRCHRTFTTVTSSLPSARSPGRNCATYASSSDPPPSGPGQASKASLHERDSLLWGSHGCLPICDRSHLVTFSFAISPAATFKVMVSRSDGTMVSSTPFAERNANADMTAARLFPSTKG